MRSTCLTGMQCLPPHKRGCCLQAGMFQTFSAISVTQAHPACAVSAFSARPTSFLCIYLGDRLPCCAVPCSLGATCSDVFFCPSPHFLQLLLEHPELSQKILRRAFTMWRVVPTQGTPSPLSTSCPNTYTVIHGLAQVYCLPSCVLSLAVPDYTLLRGLYWESSKLSKPWAHGKDHSAIILTKAFIFGVPSTLLNLMQQLSDVGTIIIFILQRRLDC